MELTADQMQIMTQFVADYEGGDPEDYEDEIDTTQDAFSHYDGSAWHEASGRMDDSDYGLPARHFDRVQVAVGQQRTSLSVMDFGDVRAVCQV